MSPDSLIHVLDKDTINKIAAGEVIERPASVVKELIDNSIDAGAKNIRVELKDSGKTLISVRDDGRGMSKADVLLSPIKHATSKITSVSDLESISTMGFRGEALAAVSSVSKFEVVTKRKEDLTGTRFYLEDGAQNVSEIGAPDGTTVSAGMLFYNTPARLKYMKSDATELSHIVGMVSDLILANPDISLTLANNDKTILSSASSNLFNSVVDILGHEAARSMMEITRTSASIGDSDIEISGYISKPSFSKSTAENIFFIINRRPVTSKELIKAIRLGYYTKLPKDRYPAAVIHLTIDPQEVDVNVHPRKVEVRFKDESRLIRAVSAVIEETLRQNELAPQVTAAEAKKMASKSFSDFDVKPEQSESRTKEAVGSKNTIGPNSSVSPTANPNSIRETPSSYSVQSAGLEKTGGQLPLSAAKSESEYVAPAKDTEKRLKATERLLSKSKNDPTVPKSRISILDNVRVVGQISNLYILVEKDGGLLIIDQHAAHERIFYDILKKRENTSIQELISPIVVHLTPKEKALMDEYIPYLEEVGFGVSEFGDCSYAVSFVPIVFGRMEDVSTIHDFISDLLSLGKIKDETGIRDVVAKRTACRAAIKAGASCSTDQMNELIRQLKQTENPYSCPHGRPTILIFTEKELEKLFERS